MIDAGGYPYKVEYNTSPYVNGRRGAHLFSSRGEADKFAEQNFLRDPRVREWVMERRNRDGKETLVGRWK